MTHLEKAETRPKGEQAQEDKQGQKVKKAKVDQTGEETQNAEEEANRRQWFGASYKRVSYRWRRRGVEGLSLLTLERGETPRSCCTECIRIPNCISLLCIGLGTVSHWKTDLPPHIVTTEVGSTHDYTLSRLLQLCDLRGARPRDGTTVLQSLESKRQRSNKDDNSGKIVESIYRKGLNKRT